MEIVSSKCGKVTALCSLLLFPFSFHVPLTYPLPRPFFIESSSNDSHLSEFFRDLSGLKAQLKEEEFVRLEEIYQGDAYTPPLPATLNANETPVPLDANKAETINYFPEEENGMDVDVSKIAN